MAPRLDSCPHASIFDLVSYAVSRGDESGRLDLRYIQELLRHGSWTTEIYTHVSTKNIQSVKSPFDDLDI